MRYEAPQTVKAAVALLAGAKGTAYPLAGGSDLLVRLRTGFIEPDLVVDLKRIDDLHSIKVSKTGFRIGAATSIAAMGEHKELRKAWPGVVEAAELIGSKQVQGRATVIGNLCNASPAADSVPALVAAGAKVEVVGPKGKRTMTVEELPAAPGKTNLKKGEIVTALLLPARAPRGGDAYLRLIPRSEMDIAVVGVGVSLSMDEKGICKKARVSLGAVAARVLLVEAAAKALIGTKVDKAALEQLAAAASAACKPINDKRGTIEYRTKVAGVLAVRAAKIALKRAGRK